MYNQEIRRKVLRTGLHDLYMIFKEATIYITMIQNILYIDNTI